MLLKTVFHEPAMKKMIKMTTFSSRVADGIDRDQMTPIQLIRFFNAWTHFSEGRLTDRMSVVNDTPSNRQPFAFLSLPNFVS
jgi:hypothetical protein